MRSFDDVSAWLRDRGADRIEHPGGTLLEHLRRTAAALGEWGCDSSVSMAGLCHAAYGTDGFDVALLSVDGRRQLRAVIGEPAEAVVYCYAACDRRFTYAAATTSQLRYRDRFTGEEVELSTDEWSAFVDITVANELDLYEHSPDFRRTVWPKLSPVFEEYHQLVPARAWTAYRSTVPRPARGGSHVG